MGHPENDDSKESWEESENKAIEAIRSRLKIAQEMKVSALIGLVGHAPHSTILARQRSEVNLDQSL